MWRLLCTNGFVHLCFYFLFFVNTRWSASVSCFVLVLVCFRVTISLFAKYGLPMPAVIYVAVLSGDLKCIHNLPYLAGFADAYCYHSAVQYSFAA